MQMTDT